MLFQALRNVFHNLQFFFVFWLLIAVKTSIATSPGNLSQYAIRWLNVSVKPSEISNSSKRLRIDDEPPQIVFYLLVLVYLSSAICCILLCSRLFAFCRYLHRCLPHHKHDAHCSCRYTDPGTFDEISIEISAANVHPPPPPPKPPKTAPPSPKKKTGPDGSAVSSSFPVSTHGPSSSGTITTFAHTIIISAITLNNPNHSQSCTSTVILLFPP